MPYYSRLNKECRASQRDKAREFLERGCIIYDLNERVFKCLPIAGYNKTTYSLTKAAHPCGFECDCQGFQMKKKRGDPSPICSHVLALHYWLRKMNARHREEKVAEVLQFALPMFRNE
jgi:hypothetical protein